MNLLIPAILIIDLLLFIRGVNKNPKSGLDEILNGIYLFGGFTLFIWYYSGH